ncbi:tripartite tricarboxylate transporter TctA [Rhodococcus sp. 06-412-2C]|uniref:tripartite tricarboxylate transporter permease n=1 Tax=unclassified Rhodococcus (in: high G+C Gram-positive bacteria) TaxID=192944 RepID=UPI000B9C6D95|nr:MULTISPECIES: tripartite tricarboxylate transporter permease [unclassified Rhodococcus (in: high G+C Gram-positive bacteria)]OZC87395.1 tripartite tricarboxylate transporter TctA [Rhodococcus sp. 06-412-2C]OZD00835.1 tripartite tricarboxylate transporter TctA [Rhodococcus sp. 06-412-2B]
MNSFPLLLDGFAAALTPMNLVWVLVGALLGTAVGVLPGLGSSMAVALLLPVTFSLDPTGAFIMFAGVYFGGMFGDSLTGILLNTPGNSSAIAATFEGHKMALAGRAPQALATAAIGAFVGGIVATLLVTFGAPTMARMATYFGPAEYFALAVFAFVAISAVVADSILKGLTALLIGLAIAFIGIDAQSGASRFTLGVPQFFDGISIVIVTVGMLALGEVFYIASRRKHPTTKLIVAQGRPWLNKAELRDAAPAWLRGTGFGLPFGVIPVGGSEIPTFMAYGAERRLDRKRRVPMFGRGAIRGVAAPEAAGNATAGTAMGALLTLGLPTNSTAAIMLAAFIQYGMQPGPLLFEKNGDLVWTLLASFFIAMVVLLILNLPFAPLWAKLLSIPRHYLYSGIGLFAALGVYASGGSVADVMLLIGIGLIGFLLRRYGLPLAPVLIAVVLGPLAETELRRTLAISEGNPVALIDSNITIALYSILAAGMVGVAAVRIRRRTSVDV